MWQEARKQEKKLRGIMIDYKRRAERRQAFYQKMKLDPNQLIRVYGQKCKFHMPTENLKGVSTDGQLMPWPGDPEIMIDRFDVRAHLDLIRDPVETPDDETVTSPTQEKFLRKCAYERYRTLVQIDATGASEEQYLKQLEVEEAQGKSEMEKRRQMIENAKSASKANAKIHYKYEDDSSTRKGGDDSYDDSDEEDDSGDDTSDGELSDIDINVNVLELTEDQTNHLDALACQYGVGYGQYCKQLLLEKKEFEYVKKLEEEEEERAKMPGRKGKSARRTLRAKQKTLRGSPLSFAMQEGIEPDQDDNRTTRDRSSSSSSESGRSKSPEESKVEFITEFGGDDDEESNKNQMGIIIPSASDSRKKAAGEKDTFKKERSDSQSRSRSRGKDSRSIDRKSHRRDKRCSRSRDRRSKSRERRSRSPDHRSHSRDGHKSRRQSDDRHNSSGSRSRHHSSRPSRRSRSRSPMHKSSHRSRSPLSQRNKNRAKSPHRSSLRSKSRSKSKEKDAESASSSQSYDKNNRKSSRDWRTRSKSNSRSSSRESMGKETEKSTGAWMEKTSTLTPHGNIVKRLGAESPSAAASVPVDKSALTPREKMKLRMQKLLNKQIKSDKKVEEKKKVLKEQADEERENDIYEMSKMMRDKYRDRRRSEFPTSRGPSEGSPVSNPRHTESREAGSTELPYFDASTFRYEGND